MDARTWGEGTRRAACEGRAAHRRAGPPAACGRGASCARPGRPRKGTVSPGVCTARTRPVGRPMRSRSPEGTHGGGCPIIPRSRQFGSPGVERIASRGSRRVVRGSRSVGRCASRVEGASDGSGGVGTAMPRHPARVMAAVVGRLDAAVLRVMRREPPRTSRASRAEHRAPSGPRRVASRARTLDTSRSSPLPCLPCTSRPIIRARITTGSPRGVLASSRAPLDRDATPARLRSGGRSCLHVMGCRSTGRPPDC